MSWDFNVLKVSFDSFSTASFEEFGKTKGYTVLMHPNTNLKEASGFLPIKIAGDFLPGLNDKDFLTGFELFSDPSETTAELPSKGLLKGLFVKKPQPTSPAPNEEKYDLTLSCSGSELLEVFMAHLFGLYFIESQGCECFDPQDDIEYKNPSQIEKTLNEIVDELKVQLFNETLELHIFQGWD